MKLSRSAVFQILQLLWLAPQLCQGATYYWWIYNTNNYYNIAILTPATMETCDQLMTACPAKGKLETRLIYDGPSVVHLSDIQDYDTVTRDGCISSDEFVQEMTSLGFTVEYAEYQFKRNLMTRTKTVRCGTGRIPIPILTNNTIPAQQSADTINNENTMALLNFCEVQTSRYLTNCDCIQLPKTCKIARIANTPACINLKNKIAPRTGCPYKTTASQPELTKTLAACLNQQYGTSNPGLIKLFCSLLFNKIRA